MAADLTKAVPPGVAVLEPADAPPVQSNMAPGVYEEGVERVREHIRAGDAFQVVLAQRFELETTVDALDLYRVLRATNPSPYMYLLRFAGRETPFDVVGSSPEALVTVTGTSAVVHPPAGTRPRGATEEEDVRLAESLLADPKERAEHVMLVDLARNDLGRVCVPGTVEVPDFMRVEHYSHVMHLVSTVAGDVADDYDALDVLDATFPAGTVSGAPKPRAMEIIESLEPTRRALYAGTVGYVDASGDMDMAIAIRTAVLHQGRAYVQAGAGIVADSDAATEEAETRHKARAVLSAIATAEGLRELRERTEPAGAGNEPTARRELTAAVLASAVAGGLALFAGGQTWATLSAVRPAPLPPVTGVLTGSDARPAGPGRRAGAPGRGRRAARRAGGRADRRRRAHVDQRRGPGLDGGPRAGRRAAGRRRGGAGRRRDAGHRDLRGLARAHRRRGGPGRPRGAARRAPRPPLARDGQPLRTGDGGRRGSPGAGPPAHRRGARPPGLEGPRPGRGPDRSRTVGPGLAARIAEPDRVDVPPPGRTGPARSLEWVHRSAGEGTDVRQADDREGERP